MRRATVPAALLWLAACSTEGRVTPSTGAATPLPPASSWGLTVHGCRDLAQCEDIRTALAGRMIGAALTERIVPGGQQADLMLDVNVTNVRTVSGAERVFFGAMAGRNEVASDDVVRDRTGAVLRSFKVESASAAHPFSGESGLPDAYRQFASDTVSALR